MRRILDIALKAVGLLITAFFIIVLILVLEDRQNVTQLSVQTLPPYPIVTQATLVTWSPVYPKPTPVTPPATIPPKPTSLVKIVMTSFPYPPPETTTPNKKPTQTTATITPLLPTSIPTTLGFLPKGMEIVYSETDGSAGTTTIWITNTGLDVRKPLITLVHKAGYEVTGAVSPNGKEIAYLIIPPEFSEKEARIQGGILWVMNSDGTNSHIVASEVAYQFTWSPDSARIAYCHLVELNKPKDPQVPLGSELYSVMSNGSNQKLLLSDDTDYGIYPLGWSMEGKTFYYAAATLQGQWEIWKIDTTNGQTELQLKLTYSIVQNLRLSPDGTSLLLSGLDNNGKYNLAVISIDGKNHEIIASGATGDQPNNQYSAIWSPNSKELLARTPSYNGQLGGLGQVEISSVQTKPLIKEEASGTEFFLPQSWSPDGMWALILQNPHPQSLVYLMKLNDGSFMQMPLTDSSNWITPIGWILQN